MYERVRSAEVLADLKERNSLNKAAWDGLTQDIPYQKGIKLALFHSVKFHIIIYNNI